VHGVSIKPGTGVAGWVAENRRPVCVSGGDAQGEVAASGRSLYQSHTFLSVPLEGERGLLGVLNVTDPISEQPFGAEDCHLLLHLAERVAAAWDRALGMIESQAGVEDTAQALRQVLKHLERARRIAPDRMRLARGAAKEIGLSEVQAGVISFAASIHDVGMRRLGEHLVDGGGTLSTEERQAVQRHPELGAELLRPLEMVGEVRDIVLTHHEWWDGSGYPRGLRAEEIPIGGRILAVVDAYESMTVGRAHRSAISREEALAELRRLKGRQFDPDVVEAFERALVDVERHLAADASQARAA
jgi:HD-GYP domain-containing protein (c-di-GMP phosphodiesterase class II)